MKRVIEITGDGSSTLFVPSLNEHYHSIKGALAESRHIFINLGFKQVATPAPRILEIGFGTGLNALLTLSAGQEAGRAVHYTAIELYPLPWETVKDLEYHDPHAAFQSLHRAAWNVETGITPQFTLHKIEGDYTCHTFAPGYDVVYFDAFAPEKQPEMWAPELFERLRAAMNPGGILTTYCAKGSIRRMLQDTGFTVERLPGPPGGKREVLRATNGLSLGDQ